MRFLLTLLLVLVPTLCESEVSLSHVTVLLPHYIQNVGRPRLIIEAHGGCFNWEVDSDTHQLLNLSPRPSSTCISGGSTEVELSPREIDPESPLASKRITAWVKATLVSDPEASVECEVFVDRIASLGVLTNTRKVNVDDRQSIDLQAFDSNDNVFSTLTGLPFEWSIDNQKSLKHISFAEALLDVDQFYYQNEKTGTDRLPVLGNHPGQAHVTATLLDPSRPIATDVDIIVFEPIRLDPPRAYITPLMETTFMLQTKRKFGNLLGKTNAKSEWRHKKVPSTQYKFSLSNETVAAIDKDVGKVLGLQLGQSLAIVRDVSIPKHTAEANVYVVEPDRIELKLINASVCGDGKWYLNAGQEHFLEIVLFDTNNNKMIITDNVEFLLALDKNDFLEISSLSPLPSGMQPLKGSKNKELKKLSWQMLGAYPAGGIRIKALKTGAVSISALLNRVTNSKTEPSEYVRYPKPTGSLGVSITPKISVVDENGAPVSQVLLPWVPRGPPAAFTVQVRGGSGNFDWASANPLVATGKHSRITAGDLGQTSVTVTDTCNVYDTISVPVVVAVPARPVFLPGRSETEVGSTMTMAVGVVDTDGNAFSSCSSLNLHTTMDYPESATSTPLNLVQGKLECLVSCPEPWGAKWNCWLLTVKANSPGFAEATASLKSPCDCSSKKKCKSKRAKQCPEATKALSSFPRLKPAPKHVILAVGSRAPFAVSNGPLPWPTSGFRPIRGGGKGVDMATRLGKNIYAYKDTAIQSALIVHKRGSWANHIKNTSSSPQSGVTEYVREAYHSRSTHGILSIERDPKDTTRFVITCMDITYEDPIAIEVRVGNLPSDQNSQPVIATQVVKFSCYPRLQLSPRRISLGVRTEKDVDVKAINTHEGPSKVLPRDHPLLKFMAYQIEDVDVASVSKQGRLTGLTLGHTLLTGTLDHPELRGLSNEDRKKFGLQDVVDVVVQFEEFVIKARSLVILQDHETYASLQGVNGELPDGLSFSSVRCEWTVDSSALELFPSLGRTSSTVLKSSKASPVHGLVVGVTGRRPGKFIVTANISVATDDGLSHFEQWMEIEVLEPLKLLSSPHLLLPFGAHTAIISTLDNTDAKLSYTLLPDSSLITVSPRGVISALPPPTRVSDQDAPLDFEGEAVVLVRTEGSEGSGRMSSPSEPPRFTSLSRRSQTVQTESVRVEVRAIRQIAIGQSMDLIPGPLCAGSSVELNIVLRDAMGRNFDVVEGWSTGSGTEESALKAATNRPEVLSTGSPTSQSESEQTQCVDPTDPACTTSSSGEGEAASDTTPSKGKGVLSVIRLTALAPAEGESFSEVIVKLWLAGQTEIEPLYLRVDVASKQTCEAPFGVEMRMHISPSSGIGELVTDTTGSYKQRADRRLQWQSTLEAQIAQALRIHPDRVKVNRVDVFSSFVQFSIAPRHALGDVHENQWHLAYDQRKTDRSLPSELAKELLAQLTNPGSALQQGSLTRHFDTTNPPKVWEQRPSQPSVGPSSEGAEEEGAEWSTQKKRETEEVKSEEKDTMGHREEARHTKASREEEREREWKKEGGEWTTLSWMVFVALVAIILGTRYLCGSSRPREPLRTLDPIAMGPGIRNQRDDLYRGGDMTSEFVSPFPSR